MNPQDLAHYWGWDFVGTADDGTPVFQVIDEAGVGKNFFIDASGGIGWLPDTPAAASDPTPAAEVPETPIASVTVTPVYAPVYVAPVPTSSVATGDDGGVQWIESPPGPELVPVDNNDAPRQSGTMPVVDDPTHVYSGTVDGYDVYRLTDAAGTVLQWMVIAGDHSSNIVDGTLHVVSTAPAAAVRVTVSDSEAAARGWTPNGTDAQGRQQFLVIDSTGLIQIFSVNPADGQFDQSSLHSGGYVEPGGNAVSPTPPPAVTNPPTIPPTIIPPPNVTVPGTNSPNIAPTSPWGGGIVITPQLAAAYQWTNNGVDNQGRQSFYVIDDAGTKVIFSINPADGSNTITSTVPGFAAPKKLPPTVAPGGSTATPANSSTVIPFTHPMSGHSGTIPTSWRRVGTDSAGNPVFQIVDAAGVVKQWAINGDLQAVFTPDAQTFGVYVPYAPPAPPVTTPSGAVVPAIPQGGTITLPVQNAGGMNTKNLLLLAAAGLAIWMIVKNNRD